MSTFAQAFRVYRICRRSGTRRSTALKFIWRAFGPLLIVLMAACASAGLKVKQEAVTTLTASETAMKQARLAELMEFQVGHLTQAQHLKFLDGLTVAQQAEIAAAHALQVWTPGQPVPVDAQGYLAAAKAVLASLTAANLPNTSPAIAQAQALVADAQAIITALGAK